MDAFLTEQRSMDILNAYTRALSEFRNAQKFVTKQVIIEKAMSYKAPRFYISFPMCRRIISLMNRGRDTKISNPLRRAMYEEIFRRYKAKHEEGYSCLTDILNEEAPSFYIEKFSFYRIVLQSLKGKKRWH